MKTMKNRLVIFFCYSSACFLFTDTSIAQTKIGLSANFNVGRFFDLSEKDNYTAKYNAGNGASFSSFLQWPNDNNSCSRIECGYSFRDAGVEVEYDAGHASFYNKTDYRLNQLELQFHHLIPLIEAKKLRYFLNLGTYLNTNFNTKSHGEGWNFVNTTFTDSTGNSYSGIIVDKWKKNENRSKDISRFNIGLIIGLEIEMKLNPRLDLLFFTRFSNSLNNSLTLDDFRYTILASGSLGLGVSYKIK